MPLPAPILDDRSYQQLRDELVRRIPVYTPEWTDHNASDPGVTLIELFAFLGENLLFRFNQIPEATKLEFLRLLQIPLRPAATARALVALTNVDPAGASVLVPIGSEAKAGGVPFETTVEVVAHPLEVVALARTKASPPETPEAQDFAAAVLDALGLGPDDVMYYRNEEVPDDPAKPGVPIVDFKDAVDGAIWIAVLKTKTTDPKALKGALVNVGFVPDERIAGMAEIDPCPGAGVTATTDEVVWEVSLGKPDDPTLKDADTPRYKPITVEADTTHGLAQQGIVRLRLPADVTELGLWPATKPDLLGTGDFPPELDNTEKAANLLFWLRATRRRADARRFGRVSWIGLNATEVVQSRVARLEFLGTGTAQSDQTYPLAHSPVIKGSLVVEVEGPGGWTRWTEVEDFVASAEDDAHYVVDLEAGTVRFGNGINGRAPQIGERIRATEYRYGGGIAGNVAAKAINKLDRFATVKLANPLPARGGAPKEDLKAALDRVPAELRRRDRAVTRGDFEELALAVAGVGRAECLPRFYPPSHQMDKAGVVSVVVWPREDPKSPDAPMPDRTLLREVCAYLDARRLVTTELYVIPPTYRRVAVAVGLVVKPGYGVEAVRRWVELVIRQYLAPLPPYGPEGRGWPLGRRVHGPELEAAALQVEGVQYLHEDGVRVAGWSESEQRWVPGTVNLEPWEVAQLAEITVVEGQPLAPGETLGPLPLPKVAVPVPIIREEC